MSSTLKSFVIVVVFATAATGSARRAADAAPADPQVQKQTAEKPPKVDPKALAAVERMGAFLRDQKSFTVRTTTQTDHVLASGQKATLEAHGQLQVERPNKLRADISSDRKDRQLYYDGKTFTIYSPRMGFYAQAPAPTTIHALVDQVQERYGIEMPLVDLFRVGVDPGVLADVTAATYVGPAKIGGVETDLYAFRQPGVDWQIWIKKGNEPVPMKLVLTTTDDPARPEHSIEMAWHLGARHEDSTFAFVPPKDSTKIALADLAAPKAEARRAKRSARR